MITLYIIYMAAVVGRLAGGRRVLDLRPGLGDDLLRHRQPRRRLCDLHAAAS